MRDPMVGRCVDKEAHCVVDSRSSAEAGERVGFERREERRRINSRSSVGRALDWDLLVDFEDVDSGNVRSRELSDLQMRCRFDACVRALLRA
jgi:hypothetical protein